MTLMHSESDWPTDWHSIDVELNAECRQVSHDTFQVRSPTHMVTINSEGFNLWRDNSLDGQLTFEHWLDDQGIRPEPRRDIYRSSEVSNGES